jgi:predicted N-formylglutamate amidohydrolase
MYKYVITCEHGGNHIPTTYAAHFAGYEDILKSHRGLDIGALVCALLFSKRLNYPLFYTETSRLLIEHNRTLEHPELFSFVTKAFSADEKEKLIQQYYLPYRNQLEQFIKNAIQAGDTVIHLSIHSFTPILNGDTRKTEVGILFDPERELEEQYATKWQKHIQKKNDIWRVKFNYPYLGIDDGFTSYFRSIFKTNYAGIELEINQKLFDCFPAQQVANALIPNFKFERKVV